MKILTKEEEAEHYNATLTGGLLGGVVGTAAGAAGVWAASQRYPAFRGLTLPFRVFLMTSTGTFAAIISADAYSRRFEASRHPENDYTDAQAQASRAAEAQKSSFERAKDWASTNRYGIVFGSWVLSMGTALGIVGRNPYLTGQQKLVQARVYAQGLTLAVIIASLALEGKDMNKGVGRWETVKVLDPNDPTHKHMIEKKVHHERYSGEDQWMDMVAAEEERLKERDEAAKSIESHHNADKKKSQQHDKKPEQAKDDKKPEQSKDSKKSEQSKDNKDSKDKKDDKKDDNNKKNADKKDDSKK